MQIPGSLGVRLTRSKKVQQGPAAVERWAWPSTCGDFSKYEDFMKCPYERVLLNREIWVVPDIGLPPNHLHFNGIIFNENHPAIGGTPMTYGNPRIIQISHICPIYFPWRLFVFALGTPISDRCPSHPWWSPEAGLCVKKFREHHRTMDMWYIYIHIHM